jgi:hypothetical protein
VQSFCSQTIIPAENCRKLSVRIILQSTTGCSSSRRQKCLVRRFAANELSRELIKIVFSVDPVKENRKGRQHVLVCACVLFRGSA